MRWTLSLWIAWATLIMPAQVGAAERAQIDTAVSTRAAAFQEVLNQSFGAVRFRISADAAVLGVVLWADDIRVFPPQDGLGHVNDDRVLRKLPELEALRAAAAPTAWAEDRLSPDTLVWCSDPMQACLLLDAATLAAELSVPRDALMSALFETPDARDAPALLWGGFAVLLAAGLVGYRQWARRSTGAGPSAAKDESFRVADLVVYPRRLRASRGTVTIELTDRDLRLLRHLAENPEAVLSKDELYDVGWGRDYMPNSRALDQHIATLRRKLDPDRSLPPVIETVHARGYRLHR